MAGLVGGLEDVLGLNTTAGTAQLQQAVAALQAVGVPNAAQLTLPELQKYVQAGVLSPQQYSAISENPQAYQQAFQQAQDTTGTNAQKAALQQISGVAQNGSTPIMQAQLMNAINTANQNAQANRGANLENAQERGVAGGGQEFLSNMVGNQQAATNANQGALTAGANNAQLALQAMTQGGQLGGQLQGQANQVATNQAQAAQQIAQYNSQLQSMANQYNTQNANTAQAQNLANAQNIGNMNTQNANFRTQYNAQVPQTVYQDTMGKAQALAGAYGNQANLAEQQAAGQNQFIGGLIGAGATMGGDYMLGQGLGAGGAAATAGAMNGYGNQTGTQAINSGYGSQPSGQNANPSQYGMQDQSGALVANPNNNYARGGMVNVHDPKTGLHASAQPIQMCGGGMCYAKGGEVHDHSLCMLAGGSVPGEAQVPGDSTDNDTVDAKLSPHEIVLPRSITQTPNAPQQAAKFVGQIKGQLPPEAGPMIGQAIQQASQPQPLNFGDIVRKLEENGLELRLSPKGM
jgi:hypothetical protein